MEKIICSAIWYQDKQIHDHQPKNITYGFVVAGRRHHNCIMTVSILGGDHYLTFKPPMSVQGFLTSKDRFLDRKEACDLAIANGQVKKEDVSGKLYSEDLY